MPDNASLEVRKDVWKLATWDPILEWYAKAVAEPRSRPVSDPTSWRFVRRGFMTPFVPTILTPSPERLCPPIRKRFWHNSWFFLPWRRMYLACFEQIAADA
jgi:tyrosinase